MLLESFPEPVVLRLKRGDIIILSHGPSQLDRVLQSNQRPNLSAGLSRLLQVRIVGYFRRRSRIPLYSVVSSHQIYEHQTHRNGRINGLSVYTPWGEPVPSLLAIG